jgi:PAS domain S-box-containing protein
LSYPIPADEGERLTVLRQYGILDTPPEAMFDRITRVLTRQLDVPIALISLVDESRQWFKSSVGLDAPETPRELAFCAHAIMGKDIMVVPDATADGRFAHNPLVTDTPNIRFYAGAPLTTKSGHNLGTLCVIDTTPRKLTDDQYDTLAELSQIIIDLLDLREKAMRVIKSEHAARLMAERMVKENASALIESNQRFRDITDHIPGIVYQFRLDAAGNRSIPYVSPTVKSILGFEPKAIMDDALVLLNAVVPEDRNAFETSIRRSYQTLAPWEWEGRARKASGEIAWFRGTSTPRRLADGSVLWNGLILDQSDLRETQNQLRQAQKMEAVGQLTGGVAHDFNNILAIIQGNNEMLADVVGNSQENVLAIHRATRRAADLTQHLLAFSRRQPLNPRPIELATLIADIAKLLGRSLGESIRIDHLTPPDCWNVFADSSQLENAIVNIAINARDAMPRGGTLTISCANRHVAPGAAWAGDDFLPEGDYVTIEITDTGTGMAPDIVAHAFEPFFTTKEVGKGSGLGLSMVYGFARQSGGKAMIESREGVGTTISLHLPRAVDARNTTAEAAPESIPLGNGENILVIEDNADLQALIVSLLGVLRYTPLAAGDAREARQVLAANPDIDLILSDVVLPGGTSGPEMIAQIRATNPTVKVVYMSGYPQAPGSLSEFAGPDAAELLPKPFNKARLATALRDALRTAP